MLSESRLHMFTSLRIKAVNKLICVTIARSLTKVGL